MSQRRAKAARRAARLISPAPLSKWRRILNTFAGAWSEVFR